MRNRKERAGAADAVVIGGGVVGLSVARELGRRGLSVFLVERGEQPPLTDVQRRIVERWLADRLAL